MDTFLIRPLRAKTSLLPVELLSAVFGFLYSMCLTQGCPYQWITVMLVCRQWRDTAVGFGALWTEVEGNRLNCPSMVQAIELFVSRSHQRLLSFKLGRNRPLPFDAIRLAFENMSRMHTLELCCATEDYDRLSKAHPRPFPTCLSTLRHLSLSNSTSGVESISPLWEQCNNFALESLTINNLCVLWSSRLLCASLTKLEVLATEPAPLVDCLSALANLPLLERLIIHRAFRYGEPVPDGEWTSPWLIKTRVVLPRLLTLVLLEDYLPVAASFFHHIEMTNLRQLSFDYRGVDEHHLVEKRNIFLTLGSILRSLERPAQTMFLQSFTIREHFSSFQYFCIALWEEHYPKLDRKEVWEYATEHSSFLPTIPHNVPNPLLVLHCSGNVIDYLDLIQECVPVEHVQSLLVADSDKHGISPYSGLITQMKHILPEGIRFVPLNPPRSPKFANSRDEYYGFDTFGYHFSDDSFSD